MRTRLLAPLLLAALLWPGPAQAQVEEGDELVTQPAESGSVVPAAGAESTDDDEPVPPPLDAPPDRPRFQIPLPEERGGGSVAGTAGAMEWDQETEVVVLTGGVEIHYEDVVLRADRMRLDRATRIVTAEGNVILDQGPSRITGATATYDLENRTGILSQATAAVEGGYYFSGEELARVSETEYRIEDGTFTACEGEVPPWSFHVAHADVEMEAYARIRHASMRVKAVPVLYAPYILWPTKTERSSGLLIPQVGYSNQRGSYLGLAYFQTLGRSYDTTLYADLYSDSYFGFGNEIRYRPSEGTDGRFEGYMIDDPEQNDTRWKVLYDHSTRDLPWGLRAVAHFEDYSDFRFFRDFERQLNAKARSSVYSNAFLTGNWGSQSVHMMVDRRENFITGTDVVELAQLPEIEYEIRPLKLGPTPVYFSLESGFHFLSVERTPEYRGDYSRFHLRPTVKLPLSRWPWLSLSVFGGGDLTWYGDSLTDPAVGPQGFRGASLDRLVPVAGADLVGPSFSRVFEGGLGGFSKLKHIVEPRLAWSFSDEFEDQAFVPVFDEVDPLDSRNVVRVSLINRLLGKPRPVEDDEGNVVEEGSAREILSLELARRYSLQADEPLEQGEGLTSRWSAWEATLRSYPSDRFGFRLDADYSGLSSRLTSIRLTSSIGLGKGNSVDLSWSPQYRAFDGETLDDHGSIGWRWNVFPGRLSWASHVGYDFQRDLFRDQRHLLTYTGSCYSLHLELHESRTVSQTRRDYLFSVDLKNVGTFLDLTGGEFEQE